MGEVDDGCFQSAEAHVIRAAVHVADRQLVLAVVAGPGQIVDGLAAGVRQAEHTRGLVKALAGRVVARRAEDAQVRIVAHVADERVAARDGQAHKRRLQLRVGDVVCRDVAADMVHRNERHAERERGGLGKVHADKQRADEPRRARDGHGVDVAAAQAGHLQRTVGKLGDDLHVRARGDLGHDAAVDGVQVGLRKDLVGQHLAPVAHEGDSRFITGRFDRKNNHIVSASLQNRVMSSASSSGF